MLLLYAIPAFPPDAFLKFSQKDDARKPVCVGGEGTRRIIRLRTDDRRRRLKPERALPPRQHSGLRDKLIVWADEGAMTKLIAEQANILRGL